jgi:glutathione S-transferase
MELYASPMACSLASHIAILEAGLPVKVRYIDNKTKLTDTGEDYFTIAPNGYVPALRLADGAVLNEGPSVLQYLADQKPEARLAPAWGTAERYQLIDALNYLSTEVHKRVFSPLLSAKSSEEAKTAARALVEPTLKSLARRLGERSHLVGEHFTVADAYLVVLLNWARHVGADLKSWPALAAYHKQHLARPKVAEAMAEEGAEYRRRAA